MPLDKNKHKYWYQRYMVVIVTVPLLIGIHWGWWKLQQNPELVDPKRRRNLPYYDMYQNAKKYFAGEPPKPKEVVDKEILKD